VLIPTRFTPLAAILLTTTLSVPVRAQDGRQFLQDYMVVYSVASRCANAGVAFDATQLTDMASFVRNKFAQIPQPEKDAMWSKVQTAITPQPITRDDCVSNRNTGSEEQANGKPM